MTSEARAIQAVKRMSNLYVPAQDRFRLAAELNDGEVQVLWLTQRLLRLMLAPLADHFGKSTAPSVEQKARRSYAELMHKVSGKGGPPLASLAVSREWLVESIDIRFNPNVCFVFKGQHGEGVSMEMDSLKVRRWLGILHRKSVKAGWPEALWPQNVMAELE